jgi:hypothetical protein
MSRRDDLTFRERLRASTSFMLSLPRLLAIHGSFIVADSLQDRRKPRCPRCGKRLATARAQQRFGCGLRWHGSPRPDARSEELASWAREKEEPAFRELIRRWKAGMPVLLVHRWDLCVWRVVNARWREADAWAAAGVGPDDIRALKQLTKSHWFEDPIIGIERISIHGSSRRISAILCVAPRGPHVSPFQPGLLQRGRPSIGRGRGGA